MDRNQQAFIGRMGHAAETNGLSPIAGRLFAMLLLSDSPRSLDAIATGLEVSKASVSTEARRLVERGVVERTRRAGDRRDYYELAPDFFARIVESRIEQWRRIQTLMASMRETFGSLSPVMRERFASIDEIHADVIDQIDTALAEWRGRARKRSRAAPSRRRRSA
jgi:DNA-binding transcriptional regulator GbsR (MarR family)